MLSASPAAAIEFDAGVWTDVSADCRFASWQRGRSYELDTFNAGTAVLTLDNADRRYDPEHAAGTYYGKLLPRKRVRIGFTYAATTYWKFYGFVDGWPQAYNVPNDATVTLTATDAFKVFGRARVPSAWQQLTEAAATTTVRYRLGESGGTSAADSNGSLHGSYGGGATFNARSGLVFGDSDGAIGFDGVDDQVTIPAVLTSTTFTVEAWVSRATVSDSDPNGGTIFEQGERGQSDAVSIWIGDDSSAVDGLINVRYGDSPGVTTTEFSTTRVDDDQSHHVAVVMDSGGVSIYIDGADSTGGFGTTGTVPPNTTRGARIGASETPGFVEWFKGTLDEVIVHDAALSAADVLERYEAGTQPWAGDTPKERIERHLDYIGWPAGDRDLDDGVASLIAATNEADALSLIQAVELSEGGRFFIDRLGRATLVGRQNFWTEAVYNTSNATFGDSGSELKYKAKADDLFGFDDEKIVNEARVRQFGGSEQVAYDSASADPTTGYGLVSRSESSLEARPGVVKDRADYLVYKYKDPALRMPQVEIKPERSPATLYALLGANDLGYRYTFKRRPQGVGSAISKEFHVESESGSMTPDDITITWELSPAEPQFWIWGTSTWETGTNIARWGY